MFMDNPEIGPGQANDFQGNNLACAVRLASRQFAGELTLDHAGPRERKAAEKRLRQLEAEFAVLQQGVERRTREMAMIVFTIYYDGLYRLHGQTFKEYIRDNLNWTKARQRIYQLLDYGRTLQELTTHVVTLPSEGQARILAKLPLPERLPAWKQAVETTKSPGHVSMAHLNTVVARYAGPRINRSRKATAEKSKVIALLRRWAELGRYTELRNVANECAALLREAPGVAHSEL